MSHRKARKLAQKSAAEQERVLTELERVARSIERGEQMVCELKEEADLINEKHAGRKTTREDIAYLEDLLRCAKKKLAWEKHADNLAKRIPPLLARVTSLMNDPLNPPSGEVRDSVVRSLHMVQAAMQRLENVRVG